MGLDLVDVDVDVEERRFLDDGSPSVTGMGDVDVDDDDNGERDGSDGVCDIGNGDVYVDDKCCERDGCCCICDVTCGCICDDVVVVDGVHVDVDVDVVVDDNKSNNCPRSCDK